MFSHQCEAMIKLHPHVHHFTKLHIQYKCANHTRVCSVDKCDVEQWVDEEDESRTFRLYQSHHSHWTEKSIPILQSFHVLLLSVSLTSWQRYITICNNSPFQSDSKIERFVYIYKPTLKLLLSSVNAFMIKINWHQVKTRHFVKLDTTKIIRGDILEDVNFRFPDVSFSSFRTIDNGLYLGPETHLLLVVIHP